MILTYLTTRDLINISDQWKLEEGKLPMGHIGSLAEELELRFPEFYTYPLIFRFLNTADSEPVRRFKDQLFTDILEVLGINPQDISDKFIEQPLMN